MNKSFITGLILIVAVVVGCWKLCEAQVPFWMQGTSGTIKSVTLQTNGTLEVVRVVPSQFAYPEGGGPPGTAFRDIYKAKDGKIVLSCTVTGIFYPYQLKPEQERIEWK